jgi:zinc protease
VSTTDQVTRLTLANGLAVFLKEIHTSPIISQWVWYRVGSRYETPGLTGISHWTEHMQFKGTVQFPAGSLDKAIAREGGYWNAFTFLDWTAYFETMPADKIDLALRLEADRMANSQFDPEAVDAERTVIISERQGSENDPLFLLTEALQAAAFQVHPYRHQIIGDLVDLRTIQAEDLLRHYRAYYRPNNAVLALAGDFESEAMLARLRPLFEPLPGASLPPLPNRPEPQQPGERRVTVAGPGETTYLQVAYHAPAGDASDFLPYLVLDSLLSGPSNLNTFGGGISNRTSRLYRALVEGEWAVSVAGGLTATVDPFLHSLVITVHPRHTADEVLAILDEEIRRLQDTPPPPEEVARAVKQARALFAYGSESISNQAFWMGYSAMFADYEWFTGFLERLAAVTPADVQRIARAYLSPHNRVVGVYLPEPPAEIQPAGMED